MLDYVLIVLLMASESFFSGSETGFYCTNRLRLRFRLASGWPGAAALHKLSSDPKLAISTMLIGTNISVFLTTVLCARRLVELGFAQQADLYSSLLVPPVLLVFAEIIPKSVFQRRADTLMYKTAPLMNVFRVLFWPLLVVLGAVRRLVRAVSGRPGGEDALVVTAERFRFFLSEGAAVGILSPYQQAMADNILRVKSIGVRAAMVLIEDAVMIRQDAPLEELKALLREHRFSRIPLYSESRTNVTGVINVIDLLCAQERPHSLTELCRKPHYIESTVSVAEAFYSLQKARHQLAVVTGPDGAAVGILTVKDLVEEIVGELKDW